MTEIDAQTQKAAKRTHEPGSIAPALDALRDVPLSAAELVVRDLLRDHLKTPNASDLT